MQTPNIKDPGHTAKPPVNLPDAIKSVELLTRHLLMPCCYMPCLSIVWQEAKLDVSAFALGALGPSRSSTHAREDVTRRRGGGRRQRWTPTPLDTIK